jgi:hypothetical protein
MSMEGEFDEELKGSLEDKPDDGSKAAAEAEKETPEQIELKATRKELAEARAVAAEKDKLAQFWADRASKVAPAAVPAKEAAPRGPVSAADFVDAVTSKGVDAIREQGFIRESDLDALVEKKLAVREAQRDAAISAVQEVMGEMGLDKDPELFSETTRHLKEIGRQYPGMDQTAAIRWAAERAQGSMTKSDGGSGGNGRAERTKQVTGGDRGASRGVMSRDGSAPVYNSNDNAVLAAMERHGLKPDSFKAAKARGRGDY